MSGKIARETGASASAIERIYGGGVTEFYEFCVSRGLDFVVRTVGREEREYANGGYYFAHVFNGEPRVPGLYSYGATIGRAMLGALLRYITGISREKLES